VACPSDAASIRMAENLLAKLEQIEARSDDAGPADAAPLAAAPNPVEAPPARAVS